MGADLIVYILKGPRELDVRKKGRAIATAQTYLDAISAFAGNPDDDKAERKARKLFGCQQADLEDIVGICLNVSAKETVETLLNVWNTPSTLLARDTCSRGDPGSSKDVIKVAGDSSWGDEPDGLGYQTFKMAEMLGLFEVFGIR